MNNNEISTLQVQVKASPGSDNELLDKKEIIIPYKAKIKWVILILLLIALIVSEAFWRQPLFDRNQEIVPSFQQRAQSSEGFFKVITQFGTEFAIIPICLLVFLFFPLKISFPFIMSITYSTYFTNLFKIIYSQERPFWVSDNIKGYQCDGGFGNPSGHSFSSTSFYLPLAYILTSKTKLKTLNPILYYIISGLIYVILGGLALAVIISRIFLGMHSINQVLYGSLLGILLFFAVFGCLNYQNMSDSDFIDLFTSLKLNIIFFSKYILMFLVIILVCIYDRIDLTTIKWVNIINKLDQICPVKSAYDRFNENAIYAALPFLTLVSSHLGLVFLCNLYRNSLASFGDKPIDDSIILNFNKVTFLRWFLMLLIIVITVGPWFGLFTISSKASLGILLVFKTGLPFFIVGFMLFGISPWLILRWLYRNEESLNP